MSEAAVAPRADETPPAAAARDQPIARPSAPPANLLTSWRGALFTHLQRHKTYPRGAQMRRQEGTVVLRFTLDRNGRILSARIERESGFSSLDEEGLALLERAQPLPVPPDGIGGETIEISVPIQFSLR